jgi:transcriptional regulator with GAF, ATPase, and Fis domain
MMSYMPRLNLDVQGSMQHLIKLLESRNSDEQLLSDLLSIIVDKIGAKDAFIALPDSEQMRLDILAQITREREDNSFLLLAGLSKVMDTQDLVLLRGHKLELQRFERTYRPFSRLSSSDRYLMMPLVMRNTTIAVLVLELGHQSAEITKDNEYLGLLCSIMGQTLVTQIVPNFKSLNSRPYQKVTQHDLDDINKAVARCAGNKTMAAKTLGLTPRQLRYRLSKLEICA